MSRRIIPLILLLLSLGSSISYADMALVPRTGQTTSYTAGDDGDTQMGVAWPSPRFSEPTPPNGTVTDNLTGLVWLKEANCFSAQAWATAIAYANGLASGACGLTDGSTVGVWRLPNRKELKSLINRQQANMAAWLSGLGFSNVQSDDYWSSSTFAGDTSGAWYVNVYSGYVNCVNKNTGLYIWPVRSGQ